MKVAGDFGLSVSISKTKAMVTGRQATDGTNEVEFVSEFPYLGAVMEASGRMGTDTERRISLASKAFGALRRPVFMDKDSLTQTKRKIYDACVLSVYCMDQSAGSPSGSTRGSWNPSTTGV